MNSKLSDEKRASAEKSSYLTTQLTTKKNISSQEQGENNSLLKEIKPFIISKANRTNKYFKYLTLPVGRPPAVESSLNLVKESNNLPTASTERLKQKDKIINYIKDLAISVKTSKNEGPTELKLKLVELTTKTKKDRKSKNHYEHYSYRPNTQRITNSSKPKFSADLLKIYDSKNKNKTTKTKKNKNTEITMKSLKVEVGSSSSKKLNQNQINFKKKEKPMPIPPKRNYRDNIEYKEKELLNRAKAILSIGKCYDNNNL